MLQTLGDAQFYVNSQKCVIGVSEILVLGCIAEKVVPEQTQKRFRLLRNGQYHVI